MFDAGVFVGDDIIVAVVFVVEVVLKGARRGIIPL
jgi:hypothetical protein